jgi:hypothetical protein
MSAVISRCGQYRYMLSRAGDMAAARGPAVFIMLNPSTADAEVDDPTIRRCRGFAQAWRCNGIQVLNLYALRSTDPKGLWTHPEPVGPDNDEWLGRAVNSGEDVVCAWGANARPERVREVVRLLHACGARLKCLGVTQSGAPRHPLYIAASQKLEDWCAHEAD